MFDTIKIKSRLKDYSVDFINDPFEHLISTFDSKDVIIIIDEKIANLYNSSFLKISKRFKTIEITVNENNKTLEYCQEVIARLISIDVRKTTTILAIGGGITQDIVAFISSILFRGINWIFYPTTLLAQADSCIGSKSSINFQGNKNLLGTFIPPDHIYISTRYLETLSQSEIKSGIGEMLHYFLNSSFEITEDFMLNYQKNLHDVHNIKPYIKESLLVKKSIIEIDEFDTEIRHIFNYGHTFGHAIESITKYEIPHGQAITIGMNLANFISLKHNLINKESFDKMYNLLKPNIIPFQIKSVDIEKYCIALSKDKKNKGKQLGCILTEGPGKMKKHYIDIDHELINTILEYFEIYGEN